MAEETPPTPVVAPTPTKAPRVAPFVSAILAHPRKLLGLFLFTALVLAVLVAPFFDLSKPDSGLRIRDGEIANRADAWYDALLEAVDALTGDTRVATQSREKWTLDIIFLPGPEGPADNVFTPARVARMAQLEDSIVNHPRRAEFCLVDLGSGQCKPPRSLTPELAGLATQAEIDAVLKDRGSSGETAKALQFFVSRNFNATTSPPVLASAATRFRISFAWPLAGYLNPSDRPNEQEDEFAAWVVELLPMLQTASSSELKVLYMGDGLFIREALDIMGADLMLSMVAICLVFLAMTVHTRSLFLAAFGILQVLLAFPVCFSVYRLLLGIKMFGALQVLSVFVLMGIGADDVYVYNDALTQSRMVPVINSRFDWRMNWAFHRAWRTMLTTSLTTAFAFTATAVSTIPAIRYFGVFSSLLVLTNFCLVITFYSTVLIVHYALFDSGAPLMQRLSGKVSLQTPGVAVHTAMGAAFGSGNGGIELRATDKSSGVSAKETDALVRGTSDAALAGESSMQRRIGDTDEEAEDVAGEHGVPRSSLTDDVIVDEEGGGETAAGAESNGAEPGDAGGATEGGGEQKPDASDADETMAGGDEATRGDDAPTTVAAADAAGGDEGAGASGGGGSKGEGVGADDLGVTGDTAAVATGEDGAFDDVDLDLDDEGEEAVAGSVGAKQAKALSPLLESGVAITVSDEAGEGASTDGAGVAHLRLVERVLHDVLAPFVIRHRRRILAVFALQLLVFGSFAVTLRPATETFSYWPEDHHFNQFYDARDEQFSSESTTIVSAKLVWGVDEMDRSGTDPTDVDDVGVVAYDTSFDPSDPAAQQFIYDICEAADARHTELFTRAGEHECFMKQFGDWRMSRQQSFPVPADEFIDAAVEFLGRPTFGRRLITHVGFDEDRTKIRFLWESFNMTVAIDGSFDTRQQVWVAWQDFISERTAVAPPTANQFYVTHYWYFVWMQTQFLFLTGAFGSMGVSIILAFCMLLVSTGNWIITCLATGSILGIVATLLGLMAMLGWSLGTIETVCVTILVGVSVDFTVHWAVAFTEAPPEAVEAGTSDAADTQLRHKNRSARVHHAFLTIGISMLGGAVSTIVAVSLLLVATITFFTVFAQFFLSAILTAIVYAFIPFAASAAEWGPIRGEGNVDIVGAVRRAAARVACAAVCRRTCDPSSSADAYDADSAEGSDDSGAAAASATDEYGGESRARARRLKREAAERHCALGTMVVACVTLVLAAVLAVAVAPVDSDDDALAPVDDSLNMPAIDALPFNEWTELRPRGGTECSRGAPYAFFFRRAAAADNPDNNLVVEFEGGGGCWSASTCSVAGSTFKEDVAFTRSAFLKREGRGMDTGIRDHENEENPVKGWHHLYVPYCSGDLHWGDAIVQYSPTLRIRHKGAVNAASAVAWVASQVPTPAKTLTTGCSAGGYASIMWAAHIFRMFPDAHNVHFADSAAGVVTPAFMTESFGNWNASGILPYWAFGLDAPSELDVSTLRIPDVFQAVSATYPRGRMSSFSSHWDWNQAFFRLVMLHDEATTPTPQDKRDWASEAAPLDARISSESAQASTWRHSGDNHCVIPYDRFYAAEVGGVRLVDWLADLIRGDDHVDSVDCETHPLADGASSCDVGLDQRVDPWPL